MGSVEVHDLGAVIMEHSEIKGFTDQSVENKVRVNENKVLEEKVLRQLDILLNGGVKYDQRCIALGRTKIQEAFMWINRGIFQPTRIDGEL